MNIFKPHIPNYRTRSKYELRLMQAARELRLAIGETDDPKLQEQTFKIHQQIAETIHEVRS